MPFNWSHGRFWHVLVLLVLLSGKAAFAETAQVAASHTGIPFKQDKQSTDSMAYQGIAGVLLAGLAAYGIIAGLKRYRDRIGGSQSKPVRRLRTLEAVRLGKSGMLYVVEYDGRQLLIAEGPQGMQLLDIAAIPVKESSGADNV